MPSSLAAAPMRRSEGRPTAIEFRAIRANVCFAPVFCQLANALPQRDEGKTGTNVSGKTASAGWEWRYAEHGHELPADKWATVVGTTDAWNPMDHLEELVGSPLERDALNERRFAHELSLIEAEELRPGISDYLAAAERRGL